MINAEIKEIITILETVVQYIRTGDYHNAASKLNIFSQKVQHIFSSNNFQKDLLNKLIFSLETITMMQENNDWVAIADVIEFEFIDLLKKI